MMNKFQLIQSENVSIAWLQAFEHVVANGDTAPMVVSIHIPEESGIAECETVRDRLDGRLVHPTVHETAATVFPHKLWADLGRPHCEQFSAWYLEKWMPRYRRVCKKRKVEKRTYFERMIAYEGHRKWVDGAPKHERINQIARLIDAWEHKKARPIRSVLQIALLDPRDEKPTAGRHPFPCLQQISITYDDTDKGSIGLNAFYPVQYMFKRAYGNYLGLCHLGDFLAHNLGLHFSGLNVYIGVAKRDSTTVEEAKKMLEECKDDMPDGGEQ